MTVHVSTLTGPSYSAATSRGEVAASASACASAHWNPFGRRLGRVDADGVLGDEAAVRRAHAVVAGVGAQPVRHRRDRMGDVVVPRSARERQAAGHGQAGATGRRWRARAPARAICTADGKHEYRSTCATSSMPMPASSSAWRPAARIAGDECRSPRVDTADVSCASVPLCGKPNDHAGTPSRSAASTEHMSSTALCSTMLFEFMSFGYGKPIHRLSGPARADLLRACTPAGSTRSGSSPQPH